MMMPALRPELRDYLMAGAPKSLLLIGDRHSKPLEDAMKVASFLLGSENLDTLQDYMFVGLKEDAKSLLVEDAECIIEKGSAAPYAADRQVVVVDSFDTMNIPAQNKLLKLLEESETVLVIAVAYQDTLLPTIKSRMQVVRYMPLSLAQYEAYAEEHGIANPLALYYMTGGIVEDIASAMEQEALLQTFVKVSEACSGGLSGLSDVLLTLHLVREKDRASFYETYPTYAQKMLSLVTHQIVRAEGVNDRTEALLDMYNREVKRMSDVSFTKDDFFNFLVQI